MLKVADDDAESCKQIGEQGLDLIRAIHRRKSTREPGVSDRVRFPLHKHMRCRAVLCPICDFVVVMEIFWIAGQHFDTLQRWLAGEDCIKFIALPLFWWL